MKIGLKKTLAGLAATTMVWSVAGLGVGQTVPEFQDVPEGHIAKTAIDWAASKGITMGVGNNRFGMGQTLTRYEAVTFLCRAFDAANCNSGTRGSERFADVPAGHWADFSVGWAVQRAITAGVSATEFGGSQTLTREQMITFLYRAKGEPTGGRTGSDIYRDGPRDSSHWANLPIGWAFDQGITGGVADGVFGFGALLSREEMVLFLCRAVAPGVCTPSQVPIPASGPPAPTGSDPASCEFTDHVGRVSKAVYQVHTSDSIGTAFYIGNDEWLTAAHVVSNDSTVTLRRGGVSLTATVIGRDFSADLALLKASGGNLSPLSFGSLSKIGPGHPLYTVGYPVYVASEPSVTSGVFSRIEVDAELGTVVVTDAAVSPGNSGGPLLNKCGEVMALIVAKVVREDVEGISYAVAESTVREHLAVLRTGVSLGQQDATAPRPAGDVGEWEHFTAENIEGTMEGYHLTAAEHDGYEWDFSPLLVLRCGVSNDANDGVFIVTDWLIQSDVDDEGDVFVEYRFTHMEELTAEWWWSDEEFESVVWAYSNNTEFVRDMRDAGTGTLWVRIWDGFSDETHTMRFEIQGVEGVLTILNCY